MDRRAFLRGALAALALPALTPAAEEKALADWSVVDSAGSIQMPSNVLQLVSLEGYLFARCEDGLYVLVGDSPFDFKMVKVA